MLLALAFAAVLMSTWSIESKSSPPARGKRVAICFSGQMRTLRTALSSLRENFLKQIRLQAANTDIFAIVSNCDDVEAVTKLLSPVSVDCKRNPLDWTLSACRGAPLRYDRMALVNESGVQAVHDARKGAVQGYLEQLHGIQMCHKLITEHERSVADLRYDAVVRTRFDLEWQEPLDAARNLFSPEIRVPDHQQWSGLNDKVALGPPAAMAVYAGQLAGLSAFCKEEGGGRGEPPFVLQAETWLARHLQRRGIAVRPARLPVYILRASGERSPT